MEERRLSGESLNSLSQLLGASIHTIFCPNLDVAGAHLASLTLSVLRSKDHFVNFSCKWGETPKYLNDSWTISVSDSSDPLNIETNEAGALLAPNSINIYRAQPIERIDIYERSIVEDEEDSESVLYDQALVFHHGDRSFCICCQLSGPGIAESLHFSEDGSVIAEMVRESHVRLVLENGS